MPPTQVDQNDPDKLEIRALLERGARVDGVGPMVSRLLRLVLGAGGYPDGAMVRALRDDMTLDEALELEAMSLRRRDEVSELSQLLTRQAERKRPPPGGHS